jgi:hypothetical protein
MLMLDNKNLKKPGKILTILFWSLISTFVLVFIIVQIIVSPLGPLSFQKFAGTLFFPFIIIFIIISISIIFLLFAIKEKLEKIFKSFLILVGVCGIGFSLSFLSHTLIYAVFKGPFWIDLIASRGITLNIIFGVLLSLILYFST